ncbi:GcrA cell cycle regulator [Novosphingobium fuchskuhlense]|uniref:GcrA cell cycle regulator n=1 Tax=Novosphingobium fuchskuhlense TaxID=1117702 RepID=A0A124JUH3_9SPHN|nr:GcrA family cell cycle regulator [Novosphingobium fuchskuhlense]KUR71238.1 GcrA cell cycle regulator [Novosphingobium fuchskuhlense]
MSWTDERIEKLTKMWEGGATASQIAEELGGVSRNAVIGKAHRLGLKARPSPVKPNEKSEATPAKPARSETETPRSPADLARLVRRELHPLDPVPPAPENTPTPPPARKPAVKSEPSTDTAPQVAAQDGTAAAGPASDTPAPPPQPRIVSVGPGGFLRQGPGDQQAPIPPAPPRRLVPARPSQEVADKTGLLDLNDRICRWPMGHPGEPDFHFCGDKVNPGFPYCVEHCGRAYQAQLPRGHRRPPPPMPFGGPRVR